MTLSELAFKINNTDEDVEFDIFRPVTISERTHEEHHFIQVDDFIPIPIILRKNIVANNPIEVKNAENQVIGYIFLSQNGRIIDLADMTEALYSAFLVDCSDSDFIIKNYKITKDYFVLLEGFAQDYFSNYYETSGIWGGFYHLNATIVPAYTTATTEIKAIPNLEVITSYHQTNIIRAILQPYAFERFLKNYHLLELLFDWQVVEEIKNLSSDLYRAGDILRNYKHDEIERLKYILNQRVTDIDAIVLKMNQIHAFLPIMNDIFYKYGKDSNPLKKHYETHNILLQEFGITKLKEKKVHQANNDGDYKKFIISLVSYWIYRIRSSIAHSRIGEYFLTDEAFIVEFAEPLLQEVIIQCFAKRA